MKSRTPVRHRSSPRRPRRLASGYAFISHSKKDWDFVRKLLHEIKKSGVWVDAWDMDLGDPLPEKIESGISGAATFVLVLSKNSLESRWVQYESHMAVIRAIEDANFRIVVVKIDDCRVPLRFRPFLYADTTKDADAIQRVVSAVGSKDSAVKPVFRRHFVNRNDELGRIDSHVVDESVALICLYGFFGIGKRTLAEEAIRRTWQSPSIAAIHLTPAHIGARLCAELCALASIPIPPDGTPANEIRSRSLLAAEMLVSQNRLLIFDRLEVLLDDDGKPHADIAAVLSHLSSLPACVRRPPFLLSRRLPRFDIATNLRVGFVKVGGMKPEHIITILEAEASRIERKEITDRAPLKQLAKQLYGYPLAGRLAAPMLAQHSPDYLIQNLSHITSLRRDIAEAIIAATPFTKEQLDILRTLAVSDSPLSVEDFKAVTKRSSEETVADIDYLSDHNLVEPDGPSVQLHPLVSDFFWKQARSSPDFKSVAEGIAARAKVRLNEAKVGTAGYVSWLATACRTLFLCERPEEAFALRRDFIGELKLAAIELYQRQEYELALKYCDEYLTHDPNDFDIKFHKARALSRLQQTDESLRIIAELFSEASASTPLRLAKLYRAKARTFLESRQLEPARDAFLKSLSYAPDFLPALQGLAEVLLKLNEMDDAWGFVERALEVSPMDSFALSLKADILWRRGDHKQAIDVMTTVVRAQPGNATFLFRLGRFLHQLGLHDEAYKYFLKAKEADSSFVDARLSLASVCIDLDRLEEAHQGIEALRSRGSLEKRYVLMGIEAEYYLALGDLDKARELAQQAIGHRRNVTTIGLVAKIEHALARKCELEGKKVLAESHKVQAVKLLEEGLQIEPGNPALRHQKRRLEGEL